MVLGVWLLKDVIGLLVMWVLWVFGWGSLFVLKVDYDIGQESGVAEECFLDDVFGVEHLSLFLCRLFLLLRIAHGFHRGWRGAVGGVNRADL